MAVPGGNGLSDRPLAVAVYVRVSTEDQREKQTIEAQIDHARGYCSLYDLAVVDWYRDDGVSGTVPLRDRPEGGRLLADARAGKFDQVLVYRLDRMARKLTVLLDAFTELDRLGVALRSMTEPIDSSTAVGRLFLSVVGSFAEFELESIRERMDNGRTRAAREGRWLGGLAPLGYRVVDKHLEIDPEEAALVRRIFALYAEEGMGQEMLAALLNAEGVPTLYVRRGRAGGGDYLWRGSTLSSILRNPVYTGRFTVGKQSKAKKQPIEYDCPAIISEEVFRETQRLLKQRQVLASRNALRTYTLRGLIKCRCGRTIAGEGRYSGSEKIGTYHYYSCKNGHYRGRAMELEDGVWSRVRAFAWDPGRIIHKLRERLTAEVKRTGDTAEEVKALAEQIKAKESEADSVLRLYRTRRISEAQLERQLSEINREAAAFKARRDGLLSRQVQQCDREADLLSAQTLLLQLRSKVEQIDLDARSGDPERVERATKAKMMAIRGLVETIELGDDDRLWVTYRFADNPGQPQTKGERKGSNT